MNRFIEDLKKYKAYLWYAAKSELKSEVASSHLNWLWWILDPLCFMLIYMFIALVVFKQSEPYFPIFVFVGLTLWNFFSKSISSSVLIIKKNAGILNKIYLPRFILILQIMMVQTIKMLISWGLVMVFILFYQVPIDWKVILVVPYLAVFFIVTFGFCTILLHIGVFINDLSNIITVLLRFVMYLSGIFYSIRNLVPYPYNKLILYLNPGAYFIDAIRESLIYQRIPNLCVLFLWLIVGIITCVIGVKTIYKYENTYAKVT